MIVIGATPLIKETPSTQHPLFIRNFCTQGKITVDSFSYITFPEAQSIPEKIARNNKPGLGGVGASILK